ncbi:hypothetical protein [Megalodesulfovibrio paquesii]
MAKKDPETPQAAAPAGQEPRMPLMYIGPRCRDPFPLERGNVFTSLPAVLQRALAADAALAALFVPLSQVATIGPALRGTERSAT